MSDYDRPDAYALDKLSEAIHRMVVGQGDVRARLLWATDFLCRLAPFHFPEDLRGKWESIEDRMTKLGPRLHPMTGEPTQDAFMHTLSRIRNKTGYKIAVDLYDLYQEVRARMHG